MAYRKRTTKKTTSRRGRMGAVRSKRGVNITSIVGTIAGGFAAGIGANLIASKIDNPNAGKLASAGVIVLGALLPKFIKGDLGSSVGAGMIAVGGYKALQEFNIIGSIPLVSGYKNLNLINGVSDSAANSSAAMTQSNATVPFRPTTSQVVNSIYRRVFDGRR
jgi:hypothetical protein